MKIFRFSLLVVLMVAIGPIQGWSAETQKKSATTLQQQKTMTPLVGTQTLQGSSPTVKAECQKAGPGQPPGSPSSGPCAEKGVNVGSQKNIGGTGGTPDVSKSIPGYGASSKVTSGQSTGLVDPRGKKEDAKDKPTGKFEDLSSKGKLEKLMDPANRVKDEQKAMGASTKGGEGVAPEVGTTTIKPGEGKNTVSKREQQSEGAGTTGTDADKAYKDGEKAKQREDYSSIHRYYNTSAPDRKMTEQRVEFKTYADVQTFDLAGKQTSHEIIPLKLKTPTPDAVDTTHPSIIPKTPSYLQGKAVAEEKTLAEKEAERKRQVTLSNDQKGGQPSRTDLEKTYMSPEEMQKRSLDRMTGGAIDPAEGEGTTPSGGRTSKQTKQPFAGKGPQPGDPIEEILGGTGTTTGPSTPSKTGQ